MNDNELNEVSEGITNLGLNEINERIKKEYCKETEDKLNNNNLMCKYKECKSVKEKEKNLKDILKELNIELSKEKEDKLISYMLNEFLVPPGTKGNIRGREFNKIINNTIQNMNLDEKRFEIIFEEKKKKKKTDEIPDFYINDRNTNKSIIGMTQTALWGGGQQSNRGSKYIKDTKHNTENSKLLNVVCNHINIKSEKNKQYELFNIGFKNNTICYIKNLPKIINDYFDL